MDAKMIKNKVPFTVPTLEIIHTEDLIVTSGGGFEGEWDMNIPEV